MQTRELREYCLRRGWEIGGEYVEVEHGNVDSRPQLNELFRQAKMRRLDAVVVYRYDRFARSMRQLVNALAEFNGLGINFVSLREGVDTSTPQGHLFFGIIASPAEFERELICSRVRSGLAAARAKGKTRWGWGLTSPATKKETTTPVVRARIRGVDQIAELPAGLTEVCWHCSGQNTCDCATCNVGLAGDCGALSRLSRTGRLCWPTKDSAKAETR